ncbi:hypothetical protein ELE36_14860 [Pseudolysobacter antarcticus]|uniref:Uncharacterized protein n=1 Tax=Pseudolysobacter antarcticus TaxID=2511995 RepID=A0A411HM93_9GAMM|nr:hypothetical protein [Pseudolysobacter antarcticus]QBB71534.1 hypothetical protein ELE36_14860 [Pseudolysobacter antarcticus]
MAQQITVSLVGLESNIERRVGMAIDLLAASGIKARILPWDGTRRDIVIADIDDAYGRSAVSLTQRRKDPLLAISASSTSSADAIPVVLATAQIAELSRRIKEIIQPTAAPAENGSGESSVGGLLKLCVDHDNRKGDLLAKSGPFSILIRFEASRVMANSHSDLAAARSRLLSGTWTAQAITSDKAMPAHSAITRSLDAFLIDACEAVEQDLPMLGDTRYRIPTWPDMGILTDDTSALRLSSALTRSSLSVADLARRCNVDVIRANAFCWAMRTSGLLMSDAIAAPEQESVRLAEKISGSLFSRLARRFNLSFGAENGNA